MEVRINKIRGRVNEAKAKYEYLRGRIDCLTAKRAADQQLLSDIEEAKKVFILVAKRTQENMGARLSDLVTLALDSVFADPYTFQVEFVERRGVTEADLWFRRGDNLLEPMGASGGGPIDIASLALRLAIWSLNKNRPVFVLDEPFRNLSLDRQAQAGYMLQELCGKLGVQIIMVSHNPEIISGADKIFRIEQGKLCSS